jgi:hypothetical protein
MIAALSHPDAHAYCKDLKECSHCEALAAWRYVPRSASAY